MHARRRRFVWKYRHSLRSVSNRELAEAYHLNRHTVAKWRRREGTEDASHRPQRLYTTLTPVQEAVVVELRKTLLLPLDDLAYAPGFVHVDAGPGATPLLVRCH